MSTDRELLEMAAKAAGYTWVRGITDAGGWWHENPDLARPWNPLTDDGDALRLAVKLHLDLVFLSDEVCAYADFGERLEPIYEQHLDNEQSATRRAIVRAAAEIGRSM